MISNAYIQMLIQMHILKLPDDFEFKVTSNKTNHKLTLTLMSDIL